MIIMTSGTANSAPDTFERSTFLLLLRILQTRDGNSKRMSYIRLVKSMVTSSRRDSPVRTVNRLNLVQGCYIVKAHWHSRDLFFVWWKLAVKTLKSVSGASEEFYIIVKVNLTSDTFLRTVTSHLRSLFFLLGPANALEVYPVISNLSQLLLWYPHSSPAP